MSLGLQELLALAVVALITGAFIFRRIRARRRKKRAEEASVRADKIHRRQ